MHSEGCTTRPSGVVTLSPLVNFPEGGKRRDKRKNLRFALVVGAPSTTHHREAQAGRQELLSSSCPNCLAPVSRPGIWVGERRERGGGREGEQKSSRRHSTLEEFQWRSKWCEAGNVVLMAMEVSTRAAWHTASAQHRTQERCSCGGSTIHPPPSASCRPLPFPPPPPPAPPRYSSHPKER